LTNKEATRGGGPARFGCSGCAAFHDKTRSSGGKFVTDVTRIPGTDPILEFFHNKFSN
jgi:hypothetical protein